MAAARKAADKQAEKKTPRVVCPSCKKRVARDPQSTKTWVVYPASCPHCGADLMKTLMAQKLATEAKPPKDKPTPPITAEEAKRLEGIKAIQAAAKGGRPTKLTWDLVSDVGNLLRIGAYNTTVMKALGIKERTWYAWLDKAVVAEAKPKTRRTKADELYVAFAMVVEQADAEGELALLMKVNRGSFGWQGSAWILERKWVDRWGRNRAETPGAGTLDALVEVIGKARAARA